MKFTEDHEWVLIEGTEAIVGITDYAQQQLGDIVFVDPPILKSSLKGGNEAGVVESVKAASEIFAPISGTVTAVNTSLEENPSLINTAPETDGWIFKLQISEPEELEKLMDQLSYKKFLETLS